MGQAKPGQEARCSLLRLLLAATPSCAAAQALCASPARLLGQELVINKKGEDGGQRGHGLNSEIDVAYCVGDAKILYPVRIALLPRARIARSDCRTQAVRSWVRGALTRRCLDALRALPAAEVRDGRVPAQRV